ncbi:MAG: hypothetical protein JRN15_06645 [Nitrososphaerota archaeon]|nr:hypothetical protein [Nitrososphaerota archaeon]
MSDRVSFSAIISSTLFGAYFVIFRDLIYNQINNNYLLPREDKLLMPVFLAYSILTFLEIINLLFCFGVSLILARKLLVVTSQNFKRVFALLFVGALVGSIVTESLIFVPSFCASDFLSIGLGCPLHGDIRTDLAGIAAYGLAATLGVFFSSMSGVSISSFLRMRRSTSVA